MAAAALVIFFILVGSAVAFVAFSGGPGRAREAYLTGGRRFFRIVLPLIYSMRATRWYAGTVLPLGSCALGMAGRRDVVDVDARHGGSREPALDDDGRAGVGEAEELGVIDAWTRDDEPVTRSRRRP